MQETIQRTRRKSGRRSIPRKATGFARLRSSGMRAPWRKLEERRASTGKKRAAFFVFGTLKGRSECHCAKQRNGQELAFGQDAVEILYPGRHDFDIGPGLREMKQARFERQQDLVGRVARAFGEVDEG